MANGSESSEPVKNGGTNTIVSVNNTITGGAKVSSQIKSNNPNARNRVKVIKNKVRNNFSVRPVSE